MKTQLLNCIDKDHPMPELRRHYFKGDTAIVSDSFILVQVWLSEEEKEDLGEGGESYPEIRGVFIDTDGSVRGTFIGEEANLYQRIDATELLSLAESVPQSPDVDGQRIAIRIGTVYIYGPRLVQVLRVLVAAGEQQLDVYYGSSRVQLEGVFSRAVVMGLIAPNKSSVPRENYTLEEIQNAGDLL